MHTLSKSDYKLARDCPTKLYYRELRYPDRRAEDPYLALLAEGGYMVEALAKAQRPAGIPLEYGPDVAANFARTMELLARDQVTLFEATLLLGRRLARVDILEKNGSVIRLIEVKAKSYDPGEEFRSSRGIRPEWREYLEDVTYQTLLLRGLLPGCTVEPYLLLVDKTRRAKVDRVPLLFDLIRRPDRNGDLRLVTARYTGPSELLPDLDLLTAVSVAAEVDALSAEVEELASGFEESLAPLRRIEPVYTSKCRDCEFRGDEGDPRDGFRDCWGRMADADPHLLELYKIGLAKGPGGGPLVEERVRIGDASLLGIDESRLVRKDGTVGKDNARRRLQIRHTRAGTTLLGEAVARCFEQVEYPLHFVDFETSRLALPYHTNMTGYGLVAFQWSCHTVAAPGAPPVHSEWLNDTDLWPNAEFAMALRNQVGDRGTLLIWSPYESSIMREVARQLADFGRPDPDLQHWLEVTARDRVLDLNAVTREAFFHPGMGGRTSIKVVLDALWRADPAMPRQFEEWTGMPPDAGQGPYASLPPVTIAGVAQDVHEGTGAMRAYQEMMYGEHRGDPAARDGWSRLLRQYCRLDTMAMVLVWEYWRRNVSGGSPAAGVPR